MWWMIGVGILFLALAAFQLCSGRAFTEVVSWGLPNRIPSVVTRRNNPGHFWFFVLFNAALGLFIFVVAWSER
jgi:hypothetical protein